MKKTIALILSLFLLFNIGNIHVYAADNDSAGQNAQTSGNLIPIDATNFPDPAFREYLSEEFDEDKDGKLNPDSVTGIYAGPDVKDLTGIELFQNLETLTCDDSDVTRLDVSKNKKLYELNVNYSKLEVLDITGLEFSDEGVMNPYYGLWLYIDDTNGIVDLSKIKGLDFSLIKEKGFNSEKKQIYLANLFEDIDISYFYFDNSDIPFPMYIYLNKNTVSYRTHVQSYGWQDYVSNGQVAGTTGEAKRLEAIEINALGISGGVRYTTHVQSYGWLPWASNGEMSGTEGEAKRLEAIKIEIEDDYIAGLYDIYYRVHAQSYGWLGWAKNGEPAGTAGYGKRLEGIQILIVRKGEKINEKSEGIESVRKEAYVAKAGSSPVYGASSTSALNPVVPGNDKLSVSYRTHVQSYGWQNWKYNGKMAGTQGESKRLEGINIRLTNNMKFSNVNIIYRTHVQSYGWMPWVSNGEMSGTQGEGKRLEAIQIKLEGNYGADPGYDVYYRVHAQSYGWLGWAKNGDPAGTSGYGKRLEGIQIVLVPKGGAAPANNYGGITSAKRQAYISK